MLVFGEREKNRSTWRKTPQSRAENQQTQPFYGTESVNETQATLVEDECSHHCANLAPPLSLQLK